jgi:acetyl-CoA carboxylase beta subunit
MRATMTTNVVVAVVLFATGGAHVQECTRKLIAMLKAWKIKSQFSRSDDFDLPKPRRTAPRPR